MTSFPLLSTVIFLPLAGALILLCIPPEQNSHRSLSAAIFISVVTAVLSVLLWIGFDHNNTELQFRETVNFVGVSLFAYSVGVDGVSLFFILLSTLLTPLCLLASRVSITQHVHAYSIAFLILETAMLGMFAAADIFLFYVFFEAVLLPMFLIIGRWGGERRVYATVKFFLYTLLGSVLMLVALITMRNLGNSSLITDFYGLNLPLSLQMWLFVAFLAAFAVKVPMWPVHTWLPDAHVEAPTAGSVILAGVLLKMGAYGFLRFSLPILPDASLLFAPIMLTLSGVAVVYASLVALAQSDMKKLIAYSSVAHMGFVTAGIFSGTLLGAVGGVVQMISHGVVSGALFLAVGVLYDRLHTRDISRYGGLARNMPRYATFLMIFTLAAVGLPGTSGFVGEFTVLAGVWPVSHSVTLALASGMVLSAAYMLWLYRRTIFGALDKEDLKTLSDLSLRETIIFVPLIVLVLWIGLASTPFTQPIEATLSRLIASFIETSEQHSFVLADWWAQFRNAWTAR